MDWLKMCGSDTSTNSRSPPGAAACPAMKRGSALALPRRFNTRYYCVFRAFAPRPYLRRAAWRNVLPVNSDAEPGLL